MSGVLLPAAQAAEDRLCRYQEIVDSFIALRPDTGPEHYRNYGGNRTFENEFDVNEYFTLLTHISPEEGRRLDYVYMGDDYGRRPLIYMRDRGQEPYVSFEEYCACEGKETEFGFPLYFNLFRTHGGAIDWTWQMVVEDTEQGFFEFIVLTTMGGQFYLWGDAVYDDLTMVCCPSGLRGIAERERRCIREDPTFIDALGRAAKINLEPKILIRGDTVTINALFFTKWGGLLRGVFVLERKSPHTGIESNWFTLVEYQCGIDPSVPDPDCTEM